ncbi:unnamed protein product [Psylliodes chrysocephalus]|uniref:ZP domain-containing protein n=1 Tax=Psylliodes chrysocephalus TaxID=3402493 RepID=A0A9P0GM36_9CUCU|nr:unnamed protein product [Psylliodes chrysocephala]
MQIQVGKGPWASEVSGIVKIDIKDDENKFDMLVRNCVAHDGKRVPIQLVDQYGYVVRPKIMSKFQKIKNFGPSASVVSFAYFQAFKFPDSMNVHFQCVIQVCKYNCPEPKCGGHGLGLTSLDSDALFLTRREMFMIMKNYGHKKLEDQIDLLQKEIEKRTGCVNDFRTAISQTTNRFKADYKS